MGKNGPGRETRAPPLGPLAAKARRGATITSWQGVTHRVFHPAPAAGRRRAMTSSRSGFRPLPPLLPAPPPALGTMRRCPSRCDNCVTPPTSHAGLAGYGTGLAGADRTNILPSLALDAEGRNQGPGGAMRSAGMGLAGTIPRLLIASQTAANPKKRREGRARARLPGSGLPAVSLEPKRELEKEREARGKHV